MAIRHGKSTKVLVNATDLSAYFNEASVSATQDTAESTAFGASAKSYVVGLSDATMSLSGLFDAGTGTVDNITEALLGAGSEAEVTVAPGGDFAEGNPVFTGHGHLTTYDVNVPLGDVVTVSVDYQSNRMFRSGRSLATGAKTATGTGDGVDNAAATTTGWFAVMHVTANTRDAGTIDVKLQDSADNSSWTDVTSGSFTQVAAAATTSERINSAVGATLRRYVRASWTIAGGTTGSYTITVAVVRGNQ